MNAFISRMFIVASITTQDLVFVKERAEKTYVPICCVTDSSARLSEQGARISDWEQNRAALARMRGGMPTSARARTHAPNFYTVFQFIGYLKPNVSTEPAQQAYWPEHSAHTSIPCNQHPIKPELGALKVQDFCGELHLCRSPLFLAFMLSQSVSPFPSVILVYSSDLILEMVSVLRASEHRPSASAAVESRRKNRNRR